MNSSYFANVASPGDILAFRDAAVTYAACRRQGRVFILEAGPQELDLADWLGLEGAQGTAAGIAYLDSSRLDVAVAPVEARALPAWGSLPSPQLESFRQQGCLPEAMFAALIRSSYGPATEDFFPTRSELGFYFDEGLLLQGGARWDEDYLQAAQTFFMEELMPAELVAKSLGSLPLGQRESLLELSRRWEEELRAVTFLVAAELQTVRPLAMLLGGLLALNSPTHGLKELVSSLADWQPEAWSAAWRGQGDATRQALAAELCPGFPEQAEAILFTAGPDLLLWRAAAVTEALR